MSTGSEEGIFEKNTSLDERRAKSKCMICLKQFNFIETLRDIVYNNEHGSTDCGRENVEKCLRRVLLDCEEKFKLFMETDSSVYARFDLHNTPVHTS